MNKVTKIQDFVTYVSLNLYRIYINKCNSDFDLQSTIFDVFGFHDEILIQLTVKQMLILNFLKLETFFFLY
jgi:hypothetical protein